MKAADLVGLSWPSPSLIRLRRTSDATCYLPLRSGDRAGEGGERPHYLIWLFKFNRAATRHRASSQSRDMVLAPDASSGVEHADSEQLVAKRPKEKEAQG
ncbi:MAG: hypothetical protein CL878_12255 [Dehalococcoidia bacterium]|nr:hypothetical protein [Dehalococcoidia bacterium]